MDKKNYGLILNVFKTLFKEFINSNDNPQRDVCVTEPLVAMSKDKSTVLICCRFLTEEERIETKLFRIRKEDKWLDISLIEVKAFSDNDPDTVNVTNIDSFDLSGDGTKVIFGSIMHNLVMVITLDEDRNNVLDEFIQTASGFDDGIDGFGSSVAISPDGNVAAVGAPLAINEDTDVLGKVYIFDTSESIKAKFTTKMNPRNEFLQDDFFGLNIDFNIDGDIKIEGLLELETYIKLI